MKAETVIAMLCTTLDKSRPEKPSLLGGRVDLFNYVEKRMMYLLIKEANGNISLAARWAGVDRKRFARLLAKYGHSRWRITARKRKAA